MIQQFFGKTFWIGLAIVVVVFLISIVAYVSDASLSLLVLFALAILVVTAKNPTHGLLGVFLELFSNPHGHLIFWDGGGFPISLRMAVFVGFFAGYLVFLLRTKTVPHLSYSSSLFLLPLILAILIGFVNGLFHHGWLSAFNDGNAYLFLLYAIPILGHTYSLKNRLAFFQILAAGAIWNVIVSLAILYLFTHFDESVLRSSYVFLRDIRLAEITNIGSGFYRIFIQSQFFVIVFGSLLIPLCLHITKKQERLWTAVLLGGVVSTLLLSLSRSFWVGVGAAFIVLMGLLIWSKIQSSQWRHNAPFYLLSLFFGVLFIVFTSLFPFPTQRLGVGDLADAFSKRTETDLAVSSRWRLLGPMNEAIFKHPVFGNGFGASVSFVTDDPRVREIHPDGVWSTSSMEWGWFELWLKMGILGPISFLLLFGYLVCQLFGYLKTDQRWIGIGLISSLIFLYVTHAFSPYLNHPIGLGFLLFVFFFLFDQKPNVVIEERFPVRAHIQKETPVPASALSLQAEEK